MRQRVKRKIAVFNHSFYLARDNSFTAEIFNKFDLALDVNLLFADEEEYFQKHKKNPINNYKLFVSFNP